ncbi:MAG: DUF2034 domain-containing protein [Anaerolineales bacterium]|nr:DUF2034 domain-containing protein [Anaerolineales bacterium]
MLQFKDAAYEILKQTGEPLHYNDLTDRALAAGILTTAGQTPHATMGSRLYSDTLREDSLFQRVGKKGYFALKEKPKADIAQQVETLNQQAREKLQKLILDIKPAKFEALIADLLLALGVREETIQITPYSNDGGIDVRGRMLANGITEINVAIQAKRWRSNVGSKIVRELRGSLKVHEQGIIITPSDFTASAKLEAQEAGKVRISLINGEALVELMIQHKVGAYEEKYAVIYLDEERWQDLLETPVPKPESTPTLLPQTPSPLPNVAFPLPIQADHKGQTHHAELLDLQGTVRMNGQDYKTPSAAAKTIATTWKEVNGWAFGRFLDVEAGEWRKIGVLRKFKVEHSDPLSG